VRTRKPILVFFCMIAFYATDYPVLAQNSWKKIKVSLMVPHPGYSVKIESVHILADKTLVLASIKSPDPARAYPMVITTVSDTVRVPRIVGDIEIFVIGKTWKWKNEEKLEFIENREEFYQKIIKYTKLKILRFPRD